ncbi:uncharacterized protein BDR25DRAFT_85952 [Lindgomyces ingoldianus]|uniref:Uncharacterized protein n=1 Tax=Lindgomyces ingoldianus TaxID=673940 RepID=A0ACB6QEG2_9PLEO|nr:uncharacterized protein BDR25DRAFT_85952 [Lindgomyces ingoldianus]KAF2465281.1 hypothetical protein BDR25DRAFT_85952 [Lindgomyces ingoldianus]
MPLYAMNRQDGQAANATSAFRFLNLPYELRLRVYELILIIPKTLDLDPANARAVAPSLRLFLVSHRTHEEAYRVFYGRNTFRTFPIHGRFFHTNAPLLARLSPRYRAVITRLELRLGPGWTQPPRGWITDGRHGLRDATKVRLLRIFVECDPASDPIFEGFRVGSGFYTEFSVNLLRGLLAQLPSISEVEFDAYPSVLKSSPLLEALVAEVKTNKKSYSVGTRPLLGQGRGVEPSECVGEIGPKCP